MSEEKKYCQCGCGEEVKNKWVRGHHSRVNNISKRSDIKERRSIAMKQRHKDGIMPEAWNKGKTAKEDERVSNNVKGMNRYMKLDSTKKKYSTLMSKNRLNGIVPTLRGSDHPSWQGGTSTIVNRIRGSHQLYKWWKKPILARDEFKYSCCCATGDLVVHHNIERMCDIIKKFIPDDKHELSWEEESVIVDDVIGYHIKNNVPGLTLCRKCHDEEHT